MHFCFHAKRTLCEKFFRQNFQIWLEVFHKTFHYPHFRPKLIRKKIEKLKPSLSNIREVFKRAQVSQGYACCDAQAVSSRSIGFEPHKGRRKSSDKPRRSAICHPRLVIQLLCKTFQFPYTTKRGAILKAVRCLDLYWNFGDAGMNDQFYLKKNYWKIQKNRKVISKAGLFMQIIRSYHSMIQPQAWT